MSEALEEVLRCESFRRALAEQRAVLVEFFGLAEGLFARCAVPMQMPGPSVWSIERNFFSTLFLATYGGLGLSAERRNLYGFMNQCLRALVTGCDNLLDDEYKDVFGFGPELHGEKFASVLAILAGDRILFEGLSRRRRAGLLGEEAMATLVRTSLTALLPSGLEEAAEEGGVVVPLSPTEILEGVHRVKTGQLFQATLDGPLALGEISKAQYETVGRALSDFGVACQLLDDLVDLARDAGDRRYNYALATLGCGGAKVASPGHFRDVPDVSIEVAALSLEHFQTAWGVLGPLLDADDSLGRRAAQSVFELLGVSELWPVASGRVQRRVAKRLSCEG